MMAMTTVAMTAAMSTAMTAAFAGAGAADADCEADARHRARAADVLDRLLDPDAVADSVRSEGRAPKARPCCFLFAAAMEVPECPELEACAWA